MLVGSVCLLHRPAMDELEEELTCPICCGLFEDPRVLLCSHTFCKRCLEGLLEGSRGPAYRTPFKCPTCRKETPHNGANSLQVNYSLRGIVEKYNKIKVQPKMSVCKQHCGQPLNIFCATDLRLICGFCATTDEHTGHKFCSMEEAYEREKGAFDELLRGVESWRSADVVSRLETLQGGRKEALQAVSRDAEKVTDYFDRLIGSLECKKSEILSDLETLKLVVLQAYDPEITKLSAVVDEHRRALAIADSFRGVAEPLHFLQRMQEFREKLAVVGATVPPARKGPRVAPLVCDFDVRRWDSLRLRDVDKIAVPHESGSYRTRAEPRAATPTRRTLALLAMLVPAVLSLAAVCEPARAADALVGALSSHLAHTGALLQSAAAACASVMGAGQQGVAHLVDSTVKFIGSCKLL
ncbi:tripartite motif-containing 13 isoform X3 [Nelusetta ayraudi]|uniref:tripartite motif-containing 13 isoform X3 n=1 Tax=Nelusetta ayraudi TaxID=303726 RepID=UPI003F71CA2A